MLQLLILVAVVAVVYLAVRAVRTQAGRPATRVIGPDDDPDFLRRLGQGDNNPR